MDFKVNREIFTTSEVIYDGSNEQSVELDYILPDYFPDIFRVLKCQLSPKIVSYNVSGEKLICETVAYIKVLYVSENSNAVNTLEQKMTYTKTIDMGKTAESPDVTVDCKPDYINCRVVNAKRLDFRGAISIKAKVISQKKQEIVTDAYGGNIQLKKEMVSYPTKRLNACKTVTVIEDLELGENKAPIENIIRCESTITEDDYKIVPNKMIIKGQADVSMLYSCKSNDEDSLECMQFNVPFSQIIDVDGLTDEYDCDYDISVISTELTPKEYTENNEIECEIVMCIKCCCIRYDSMEIVSDAYSTKHNCECKQADARIDNKPQKICEMHSDKAALTYTEGDITCVYDAWAKVTQASCRYDSDKKVHVFYGNCNYVVMAKNQDCCPVYLECDVPFEHEVQIENATADSYIDTKAEVISCSYNMTSTNSVEVKTEIKICGTIHNATVSMMICDIEIDEDSEKEKSTDYALKLYYAQDSENIWDIAKRYSTSVDAVMEENDLTSDTITSHEMLLIPFTD